MGFFEIPEPEDDVEDEDDDLLDDAGSAPWIGGVVPVELVVARSEQAAVAISRIAAFPDGFELTVHSYLHRSVRRSRAWGSWHDASTSRDELLRFGIAWPDGGRATNVDAWGRRWPDATEPAHGLDEHSGSGGLREYAQEYWAWPLPGPGDLRFVVEWPAYGISETAETIDAGLLVAAAGRARPVWQQDSDRISHMTRGGVIGVLRERSSLAEGRAVDD